jgi:hypothetical protein
VILVPSKYPRTFPCILTKTRVQVNIHGKVRVYLLWTRITTVYLRNLPAQFFYQCTPQQLISQWESCTEQLSTYFHLIGYKILQLSTVTVVLISRKAVLTVVIHFIQFVHFNITGWMESSRRHCKEILILTKTCMSSLSGIQYGRGDNRADTRHPHSPPAHLTHQLLPEISALIKCYKQPNETHNSNCLAQLT